MTRLSVNINKVALIRNARGSDFPNLVQFAKDCERFGAQGITIHPRPDERHVKFADAYTLKETVSTELNIEGYPSAHFLKVMKEILPDQVTLVPDAPDAITSDHGWDTVKHQQFLSDIISDLKSYGIRVSLFLDPLEQLVEAAATTGVDRVEWYTGPYSKNYYYNREKAVEKYRTATQFAMQLGLGINAGHDLNLDNLHFLKTELPQLDEVSIGHALIVDALYLGLENTIQMYLRQLD
jgi:pyridoxine 5-phosphate synthase